MKILFPILRVFTSRIKTTLFIFILIASAATQGLAQNEKSPPTTTAKPSAEPSARTIRFATPLPKNSYLWRFAEIVYTEAFRRLGYGYEQYEFPNERALLEVNTGHLDGETARVQFDELLSVSYPNLIRVNEPIYQMYVAAYARDPALHLADWQDVGLKKLVVGYPRGHKAAQRGLQTHVDPKRVFALSNETQGLKMLQRGRIDLLIATRATVDSLLSTAAFKDAHIFQAGILDVVPLFPYLHKKHRALVPRLVAVFKAMKEDGTFERLNTMAKRDE